jgi:hypothetical protein
MTTIWIDSSVVQYCEIISSADKPKITTKNSWNVIFTQKGFNSLCTIN